MPLNSYLTLGRSGLRVSPFCLGTMTFGEDLGGGFGAGVTDSEAMLSHYLEQGGNFIDTANARSASRSLVMRNAFLLRNIGNRGRIRVCLFRKWLPRMNRQ
jgi:aryl-alcohol dehydrogenase-like predicted oxidoreductase